MTTTDMFKGMDEGGKPSSRVLRPPGGGSSFTLGGGDDPPPKATQSPAAPSPVAAAAGAPTPDKPSEQNCESYRDRLYGGGSTAEVKTKSGGNPKNMGFNPITGISQDVNDPACSHCAPEKGARGKGKYAPKGFNPITGEANIPFEKKEAETNNNDGGTYNPITGQELVEPKEQKPVHTSTRVRQPPGGASSGIW